MNGMELWVIGWDKGDNWQMGVIGPNRLQNNRVAKGQKRCVECGRDSSSKVELLIKAKGTPIIIVLI